MLDLVHFDPSDVDACQALYEEVKRLNALVVKYEIALEECREHDDEED